jgi:hypothetical protein
MGKLRTMSIRVWVGAVLLMSAPAMVWAQRPLTYPLRSQTPGTQAIDNAYCYWQAKKETNVDTARQPQTPRTTPITFASDAGRGMSEPPLPASAAAASAGAAPGAGAGTGASQPAASTPVASGAGAASGPSVATSSGGEAKLPPLPPPEPPMTTYWRAFGDCMQSRGYGVR